MPSRSGIFRLLACLASGALLTLAFPPNDLGLIVWVALIPMIIALWTVSGKRAKWKGLGLGFLSGAVFSVINVSWLSTVAAVGPWVLGLYLALYWGAFGAFAATWGNPNRATTTGWKSDLRIAFTNAAFWAGLEWLRGWMLTGFGWNGLGVGLHKMLTFAQAADIFGVTGLSFAVIFVQLLLVLSGRCHVLQDRNGAVIRRGMALVVIVFLFGYGLWRKSSASTGKSIPLKALLVQANIPQDGPNFSVPPQQVDMAYVDVTSKGLAPLKGTANFPDWVIWPESALPGRLLTLENSPSLMVEESENVIGQVRDFGDFTLMLGMTELQGEILGDQAVRKEKGKAWNSMIVQSPTGELKTFRKHHLVIFGETIPFVETIPWLKAIYEQQSGMEYGGSFSAGESLEPLITDLHGNNVGIIPSICFEDTVPRLTRKFVRPGPQVIVNITNDGWFLESEAADQHFANSMFRAIELRRPMIRCANTGVSGAISVTGEIQTLKDDSGNHFIADSKLVTVSIPKNPPFSLYAIVGDCPIIGLGLLGWGIGLWKRPRKVVLAK